MWPHVSERQTRTLLVHVEDVLEDTNPYKEHARSRPARLCLVGTN